MPQPAGESLTLPSGLIRQGFERGLATLAATFERLTEDGPLRIDEPLPAADRFSGLLMWIPVSKAMFHGGPRHTQADLNGWAQLLLSRCRPVLR
ncbi:TetR/AcrR family transcriptional regulator C-terminal domain-containing protein [Streptomyces gelaticus]|uniref:TetR/AcrR family transcriptional regulator C-terminal domain-containing protein n=1 Tax=Streptomyces gelaticus TaxID=285446 RepID=UPI001E4F393F|nr:TetR/AcrR family transcriptional regulator C-terminal domain-containing protein [Streptomyces gelaticus]